MSMRHTDQEIPWPMVKRILLISGSLLFAILALVYLPHAWKTHSARQIFNSYNSALVHKHYSSAYDLLDPETMAAGNLAGFIEVQRLVKEHHGELLGYENTSMNTATDDDHTVYVHAVLIFDQGRVPFVYILKKKNLFWVVNAVKERGSESSDQ